MRHYGCRQRGGSDSRCGGGRDFLHGSWRLGWLRRTRLFGLFLCSRMLEFGQRLPGLGRTGVMRIASQEFLERRFRCGRIAQVFFIDLAYREQGFDTILAARVLTPQEFILTDSGTQVLLTRLKLAS